MKYRQPSQTESTRVEKMSLRVERSNLHRSPRSLKGSLAMTRRGYALLLAVVITSAVLSTASALASIIISEIRQTRQITGAISAYANAEESTERALFLLRQTNTPVSKLGNFLPQGTVITPYEEKQYFTILENDFIALPIPADVDAGETKPRIVGWEYDQKCSASWIEITTIAWKEGEFISSRQPRSYKSDFLDMNSNITISFPDNSTPVEMRVRALYCDITRLTVSGIPGRYRIVARGQEGDVAQAIETSITRKPPASGLFDFVLFSECELGKGIGRGCDKF
ncbi:MAG: hypothetical protein Q7S48_00285 [bacterium]|nr:hypothetical protein [bacterium]